MYITIHTHINTYTHIYIYIYIYTQTLVCRKAAMRITWLTATRTTWSAAIGVAVQS